jgi:hypothetical protein
VPGYATSVYPGPAPASVGDVLPGVGNVAAVVTTRYTTVNMMRTMEDILGLTHLNLNDAYQGPMTNLFDTTQAGWSFSAAASTDLKTTTIVMTGDHVRWAEGPNVMPKHDGNYWTAATKGFAFSGADRVPMDLFNAALWDGLADGKPYPTHRDGLRKGQKEVMLK